MRLLLLSLSCGCGSCCPSSLLVLSELLSHLFAITLTFLGLGVTHRELFLDFLGLNYVSLGIFNLAELHVCHGHLKEELLKLKVGDLRTIKGLVNRDLLLNDQQVLSELLGCNKELVEVLVLCQDLLVVLTSMDLLEDADRLLDEWKAQVSSAHLIGEDDLFLKELAKLLALKPEDLLGKLVPLLDRLQTLYILLHGHLNLDLLGEDLNDLVAHLTHEGIDYGLSLSQVLLGGRDLTNLHQD